METRKYNFVYTDNMNFVFDLTEADIKRLQIALSARNGDMGFIKTDDGSFISLNGLRCAVPQVLREEPLEHAPPVEYAEQVFLYNQGYYKDEEEGED